MKNFKTRMFRFLATFISMTLLMGLIPVASAFATSENKATVTATEEGSNGWGISMDNELVVYDDADLTIRNGGKIFAQEGFTVLSSGTTSNGQGYLKVNYSTSTNSSGRTGFIAREFVVFNSSNASPGTVTSSTNVWYGTNTNSYQTVGSVSAGETVVVLAVDNGWVYIEYNTLSGRKRGWCQSSNISFSTVGKAFHSYPASSNDVNPNQSIQSGYKVVYAGPGEKYARVGEIATNNKPETVTLLAKYSLQFHNWYFIEYATSNGTLKTGYIYEGFAR